MNIVLTIFAIILFFVILIVPHELGHFIAAKTLGVKVNEFAFGMGPALFQKEIGETKYAVRAFPIGGYCALEGENEDTGDPRAFNSKPGWKKIIILSAGVTMNMVTAFLIFSILIMALGKDPLTAVRYGAEATGNALKLIFDSLVELLSGGVSADDVAGPVGIVTAVSNVTNQGVIQYFTLTAVMCINLALINILPFPALDGGRIVFVIIRKITGKMISDEMEARVHAIGMILLLALIVFVSFKDIMRIIS